MNGLIYHSIRSYAAVQTVHQIIKKQYPIFAAIYAQQWQKLCSVRRVCALDFFFSDYELILAYKIKTTIIYFHVIKRMCLYPHRKKTCI